MSFEHDPTQQTHEITELSTLLPQEGAQTFASTTEMTSGVSEVTGLVEQAAPEMNEQEAQRTSVSSLNRFIGKTRIASALALCATTAVVGTAFAATTRSTKVMRNGEVVEVFDKLPTNKFRVYNLNENNDKKTADRLLKKMYDTCDVIVTLNPYSKSGSVRHDKKNKVKAAATITKDDRWKTSIDYLKGNKLKLNRVYFSTGDGRSYFTSKPTTDGKKRDSFVDYNVNYGPYAVRNVSICLDKTSK